EATHKRIRINLCSSLVEANHLGPFAEVEQPAGLNLPPWPPETVKIQSRDWATRPNPRQERVYLEHMRVLKEAREEVEQGFLDADGILRIPDDKRLSVDHETATAQNLAVEELAEKLGLTPEDIDRNWHRWMIWTDGRPATDEAIDRSVAAARD
ncbi:MAG: hypothetical protein SFV23_15635, partial [Planctomycetaceae bacterium]|nr:hypothetical protein [Planctomycetaceae bacterium]